jgi:hypothetical protein
MGPANDATPIVSDAPNRSRKSSGSTSAPARNVSTTDAKLAIRTSQLWSGSRLNSRWGTVEHYPVRVGAGRSENGFERL